MVSYTFDMASGVTHFWKDFVFSASYVDGAFVVAGGV